MCLQPNDIVGERYQIIEQLGRGGFGITYLANDTHQPENTIPVVVKQIKITQAEANEAVRNNNYILELEREANTLQQLEHCCIPKFLNSFVEAGYFYIIQEYIEGHNLDREIIAGEPIAEEQAINLLKEILEIIQFIHSKNIIHRDIKPANIIRRYQDNKLILIDFGAVKEIATEHTNASGITLTRAIFTSGYAPPEQLSGMPKFNSDLYALGIMLMQAVTGFSIRAITNPEHLPQRDRQNNCRYLWENYAPQISPRCKQIISKMIEYHFSDRYQSAGEVLQDLLPKTKIEPAKISLKQKITKAIYNFNRAYRLWLNLVAIALISFLLIIFIIPPAQQLIAKILNPPTCSVELGDHISCGEEILDPLSNGSNRNIAAEKYQQKDYLNALKYYQKSWRSERHDAETLIYLNNAFIEAINADYYTVAIAVPLSSDESKIIKSSSLSQDFLQGIAQAQTEVNLSLAGFDPTEIEDLPGKEFLASRLINHTRIKGLKVIIVDDGNKIEQAQQVAQTLVKKSKLLGIIGHYATPITLKTVDIYRKNKLAQISYGTTSKEFTDNPRDNFFRVVYTNKEEAEVIVKYIEQLNYQDKKIAIFYNPGDHYSNLFKEEIKNQFKLPNVEFVKDFQLADDQNFSPNLALKEAKKREANIFLLLPDGQVTNSLANAINVIEKDNGQHLILGGNPLINSQVKNIETTQPLQLIVSTFWHPLVTPESKFNQATEQLWGSRVNGGTAMAYDATLALIEAIKQQPQPTRKGTIEQLRAPDFSTVGVTGEIKFNTTNDRNDPNFKPTGDRVNFYPTLVRLTNLGDRKDFVPL
jgi:serine/threonine protein kinase/ABC-type branched-subunit amino acid transport system substrate-binding protein